MGIAFRDVIARPLDLAARFGGEEFVVVLHDTDTQGGAIVAQRLRDVVEALAIEHSQSTVSSYISLSIGVSSMIPTAEAKITKLLSQADRALYEAKAKGRNQVIVHTLQEGS